MAFLEQRIELPAIQVALDYTRASDALRIASLTRDFDRVIVEVGTPLIKSVGIGVVGLVKAVTPAPVVADMKTIDAADVEVSIAASNGADVVSVLAVSDNATIEKAVKTAGEFKVDVQSDLISVSKPLERALELVKIGVPIIGFHSGIDVQRARSQRADVFVDMVREVRSTLGDKVIISVAGGIKPSEVHSFVKAGADIIVIGSAITSSPNPLQELKNAVSFIY